jgi:uncharacterized protein (DUF433 family)
MVQWRGRVVRDPEIMIGKPVIAGTRITVELILRKLANGVAIEELLASHPRLTLDDIHAALVYSSDALSTDEVVATA